VTVPQKRYYLKNKTVVIERAKISNKIDIIKRRLIVKNSDAKKWKERREFLNRIKCAPCVDCRKQYNPWVMDFDHRKPELKSFTISQAMKKAIKVVKKEILKCDIVCSNCHRERTHNRMS
jgi:hypothetical protein